MDKRLDIPRLTAPFQGIVFRLLQVVFTYLCVFALTGCLIMSGEVTRTDRQPGGGNLSTTFVSAEGAEDRYFTVADSAVNVRILAFVTVNSGDLSLELFNPNDAFVFAVSSRPDTEISRSGEVQADEQGRIRYRVYAQGARNGNYKLFFQR